MPPNAGIDFNSILRNVLTQAGTSAVNRFVQPRNQSQSPFIVQQPQQPIIPGVNDRLLGAGLLAAATGIGRNEPGFVTESRQVLRNLQQPQSFGGVFGQTVQGLQQPFLPLLKQQAELGIQDIAQRAKAAFPATSLFQPQATGLMEQYLRERLVPTQQAFLGNLGLTGLGIQSGAAQNILEAAKPDPFRSALAALGGTLLAGQGGGGGFGMPGGFDLEGLLGGGQGGAGGTGGGGGLGDILGSLVRSGVVNQIGSNLGGIFPAVAGGVSGLTAPLFSSLFGAPGATQAIAPLAAAENPATVAALQQALGGGAVAPGAAASATGFQGLLGAPGFGTVGGVLSGLGSGAGGFAAGNIIGKQLPGTQLGGTASGAAGGAAAGFLVGGPVGAAIGAVAGGIGGFFGSRSASHAEKAANLKADSESQAGQGRAVADFFLPQIQATGGDISGLMGQVANLIQNMNAPGSQQSEIASLLANALVQSARRVDPSINSINDIPGVRERFISFMAQNAWVEPEAGERTALGFGPSGENQLRELGQATGLPGFRFGGVTRLPVGLVGEEGPELVISRPGTMVIPLRNAGGLFRAA